MSIKISTIALILAITVLTALPGAYIRSAHAVNQAVIPTTFSPFGPATDTLILQYYSDFGTMFNSFQAGEIDVTDWPAFPANILCSTTNDPNCYTTYADFFLSSPNIGGAAQTEYGIFQLDMNHHPAIFGKPQLQARTVPSPLLAPATSSAGCSAGFASLSVTLFNTETAQIVKDKLNNMTITGPQTFTTMDSGAKATGTANGIYLFPCSATQILQGSYVVSNSIFATCTPQNQAPCTIALGGGNAYSVQFNSAWNSISNQQLTAAGNQIHQAIEHLLNKQEYVLAQFQGLAACDDIFAPPSQGLGVGNCTKGVAQARSDFLSAIEAADCPIHTWLTNAQCVAAYTGQNPAQSYRLNDTSVGAGALWWAKQGSVVGRGASVGGYPSIQDIRAACDFLVLAQFTIAPSGQTCLDVANASTGSQAQFPNGKPGYAHLVTSAQVTFYIRTDPNRKGFGQIIADGLNFLFGTANNGAVLGATPTNVACAVNYGFKSTPQYYTIGDIAGIIFGDGFSPDGWGLYTGGYNLTPTSDHLYALRHTQFASVQCGGPGADFPNNYAFYCDPQADTYSAGGEFASNPNIASASLTQAAIRGVLAPAEDPVFSRVQQFAALKSWDWQSTSPQHSSLVNSRGFGFQAGSPGGFYTLLNMRCNPNYTPGAAYKCGNGTAGLIRRAESQDTDNLSPFQATTVWDFDVIDEVWDSMLALNPQVGSTDQFGTVHEQFMDWMTTSHTSNFNPTEVCTTLVGGVSSVGCTTQIWHLRPDLKFHDGTSHSVSASDVVFSLKAMDLVPSAIFAPSVANVASAIALDPSTIQVKLIHQSPFYEGNIGGVPILPVSIWGPLCTGTDGNIGGPGNKCGDINYDPMADGKMVGSGGFVCNNIITGAVGGSCSQNGDGSIGNQVVSFGGRIVLHRNHNYIRCCADVTNTALQKLSWADKNNDGIDNILDVADIAFHFGQADTYWNSGQNSIAPPVGTDPSKVDIGEVATVAFYFGSGTITPFTSSQLVSLDPQTDPYFCPTSGC